ncbi:UDP-N-acetylenolpyruvoylglucosamine reductase [Roseomonas fluvialis]|uniref:UDP-N-acetylenolpyruvoylglucosamine reductase n=2 Tax=Roseomonas fluvialis TaxID=1750527 RepID=A0ABN6NZY7_9PROT|nr:UDP-N-acetylmuramate dehydrogenase [Roseomonas fluvialis]BDG71112.1 UDP-N-acetylenolpyruvoylglucosamine reductase [Roseomonas fluvialis]
MAATAHRPDRLVPPPDGVPALRGRVTRDAPLGGSTWFRVGGAADVLVRPADAEDLVALLRDLPATTPLTVLGAASNLIIRDGGIAGVTLRLARGFGDVTVEAGGIVAGAAALDVTVAETAAAHALGGLEFLVGIPGTIGGAVAMNAGAYGAEVKDVLDWAEVATGTGIIRMSAADLHFAYRRAVLPPRSVVIRARLRATPGDAAAIAARLNDIRTAREATQPVRARTGGSTFKNPPGDRKAWQLIDAAGCRGLTLGAAQVSEKHCNFLINTGGATAAQIEALGEDVRARVRAATGVDLEWEIRRIGRPA